MSPESVREDIGYMRYTLNKNIVYAEKSDKMKIEYTNEAGRGVYYNIRRDIAEELIKHGKARPAA